MSCSRTGKDVSWLVLDLPAGFRSLTHIKNGAKFHDRKEYTEILFRPGNSLDVNPIENLWVIFKSRLRAVDSTTMKKLVQDYQ